MSTFNTAGSGDVHRHLLLGEEIEELPIPDDDLSDLAPVLEDVKSGAAEVTSSPIAVDEPGGAKAPSGSGFVTVRPRISGDPDDSLEEGYDPAADDLRADGEKRDLDRILKGLQDNPELLEQLLAKAKGEPAAEPAAAEQSPAATMTRGDLATQGWRGFLARLGLPVRKGAAERFGELIDHAAGVVRTEFDSPLLVGMTSFKGGSGKTSNIVGMGRVLADLRDEPVLVLDADLNGTLLPRATAATDEGAGGGTMHHLAAALRDSDAGAVAAHARDAGGGLYIVPGNDLYKSSTMTPDDYLDIVGALRHGHEFRIVLVDMSQVQGDPIFQTVLHSLDALVMVLPPDQDSSGFGYQTKRMLDSMGAHHLDKHRITLINHTVPGASAVDTGELAKGLKLRDQRDVAESPYDAHIAERSTIYLDELSAKMRNSYVLAAAALFDTFKVE